MHNNNNNNINNNNIIITYLYIFIYNNNNLFIPLKQRKQIFQINVTELKIPTGRRQTTWLFTKGDLGFGLETTEKQIPPVARWRP